MLTFPGFKPRWGCGPNHGGSLQVVTVANPTSAVMNLELRESIPNRLDALSGLATRVEPFLAGAGVDPDTAHAAHLALEEVGTNLLKYSYRDSREHEIRVVLRGEPSRVILVVEDDGRAFDPGQAPMPDLNLPFERRRIGGLGLHLVRQLASGLDYRSSGGWNRLTLHFDRKPGERATASPSPSTHQETTSC